VEATELTRRTDSLGNRQGGKKLNEWFCKQLDKVRNLAQRPGRLLAQGKKGDKNSDKLEGGIDYFGLVLKDLTVRSPLRQECMKEIETAVSLYLLPSRSRQQFSGLQ
jgi:hypothetical protein